MASSREHFGRLLLEGVVIVGSILAAFALDTWWDNAETRVEEQQALSSLRTEFVDARENIEFYRSIQERVYQSVSSVTDSLHFALERGDRSLVVSDTTIGWAYIPPTTSVSLATLESLISSGRLGIVRDDELRRSLASWGVELEELAEEELASRQLAFGALDETLRERMSTYGLWSAAERLFFGELTAEEMGRVRRLPVDTEVLGVFNLRKSILEHGLDEFAPLLDRVDEIIRLIDRAKTGT